MKHELVRRLRTRVEETPLELSVAFVSLAIGAYRLLTERSALTGFTVLFWVTLILGGGFYVAGRLPLVITRISLGVQSAGLALMCGGYGFLLLRSIPDADDWTEVVFIVFRYAAVLMGLTVRLLTTRKAVKAMGGGE